MGQSDWHLWTNFEDGWAKATEIKKGRAGRQTQFETAGIEKKGPAGSLPSICLNILMFKEVTDRLQALGDKFSQMNQKKQDLYNQTTACQTKVNRAGKHQKK